jgi:hypothetical protein
MEKVTTPGRLIKALRGQQVAELTATGLLLAPDLVPLVAKFFLFLRWCI